MTWDSIQQILRIILYSGGGMVFGDAVAQGELYKAAVGGVLAVGAFMWWLLWERKRPA